MLLWCMILGCLCCLCVWVMLDFMRYAHYNKMEYGYDLLIRCNRMS